MDDRHCDGFATELTSLCVPDSDVMILQRTTGEEFPIRGVCLKRFANMRFISKVDMLKLGSGAIT